MENLFYPALYRGRKYWRSEAMVFNVHIKEVSKWPFFFLMRLHFYAYIFNEVPVFVRNFNLCWVIAQPLASLGLQSLGTTVFFWYML